ncbi:MAG: hypothetical protein ACLSDO_00970 [Anaerotruncus colihominis]
MEAVCICGSDLHAIRGDQLCFPFRASSGMRPPGGIEVGEGPFFRGDQVCLMPVSPADMQACQRGDKCSRGSTCTGSIRTEGFRSTLPHRLKTG